MTDGRFDIDGGMPKWWVPEYRTLYQNAMSTLAPVFDNLPVIGSVNAPGAAPFYPEPCLLFSSEATNRTNLKRCWLE